MAYLTYIIDNYDRIPPVSVFFHGHYNSWHQVEPLHAKLRALNLTSLAREGYISLRCGDHMGCERQPYIDTLNPNWRGAKELRSFWTETVPEEDPPRYLFYNCCAQFAVTRKMILRRTRDQWINIRQPLLEGELLRYAFEQYTDEWTVGTFYDKY